MQNLGCVQAVAIFGTIVSGAVTSIKWQESSDNSTWTDLAGTAQKVPDDGDEKMYINELSPGPGARYVRAVITRDTQNATLRYAFYLVGDYRTSGDQDDSNVGDHHLTIHPVAGTA